MKNKSVWPAVRIVAALLLFAGAGAIAFSPVPVCNGAVPMGSVSTGCFFSLRNDVLNSIVIVLTHCGDTVTIIVLCAILLLLPSRSQVQCTRIGRSAHRPCHI